MDADTRAAIDDERRRAQAEPNLNGHFDPGGDGWPTIRLEAFHGVAGRVVRAVEAESECDPVALLVEVLAAAGNAIGPGPHTLADAARHPARLFVVLVGATGRSRKGSARAQRTAVMAHADGAWAASAPMSGFGSGEAIVAELAEPDRGDVRVFVEEGEFVRVLAVCERDGSTLSATIRDAWDGVPLRRRVAKERIVVNDHHVSVMSHITVEELQRKLTDTQAANGFANRFLWVLARRSKELPSGGCVDDAELAAVAGELGRAIAAARKVGRLARTAEAEARWAELYHDIAMHDPPGLLGAVTARAEAQILRLSVLYAVLDGSNRIDLDHLAAASALWDYCDASAAYIFGAATGDADVDRLLVLLTDAGSDGLDGDELHRAFGGHGKGKRVRDRALRLGLVAVRDVQTGGRPKQVTVLRAHAEQERTS